MMYKRSPLKRINSEVLNKQPALLATQRILAPVLLSAAFCCYNPSASADMLYTAESIFKLDGENPHSAVIADFNQDGTDDLAAVFSIIDKVSGLPGSRLNFLAGNETGVLKIEMTQNLPFDVLSMATGDFDGDGQADIAVAQKLPEGGSIECGVNEGTVIYFGSHSDKEPRITYGGCITEVPAGELSAFDANGDGFDDLLVGDELLLSYGDGSFTNVTTLPPGDKNIIDLNADGNLDLISDSETLCGIGDGSFNTCNSIANEPLVETNSDGKIVTKSKLNDAVMKLNKQATADINGDGIEDLVGWVVTSLETPTITYWRNCSWRVVTVRSFRKRGRAGRGSGYYVSRRMNQYSCSTRNVEVSGWEKVSYVSAAPIPSTTALRASLVQADGTVEQFISPAVDGVILSLKLTDVNEDGNIDALVYIAKSNNEGHYVSHPDYPTWTFFPGLGDGNFSMPIVTNLPLSHAIPGDFNGDGLMDFGRYISPVDSEHMLSVIYHEPATVVAPEPIPDPVPVDDTTKPALSITAPADSATVSNTVIFSANASDNVAVAKVVFKYNAVSIGKVTNPPYQVSWDTSGLTPGDYTLKAIATDTSGNRRTKIVNVTVEASAPAPAPSEPTGQTMEISGVVSAVQADYFMIGDLKVNIDASSIIKFQDGFGPNIKVGDPVEGKAEKLSDGSALAIKAEFG